MAITRLCSTDDHAHPFEIAENTAANEPVGYPVTATDPDNTAQEPRGRGHPHLLHWVVPGRLRPLRHRLLLRSAERPRTPLDYEDQEQLSP